MRQRGVSAMAWFYGQPGFRAPSPAQPESEDCGCVRHSHQCRDCGAEIECYGHGDCWAGGNDGCDCAGRS